RADVACRSVRTAAAHARARAGLSPRDRWSRSSASSASARSGRPSAAAARIARRSASDFDTSQRRAISSSARTVSTSRVYVDLIVGMAIYAVWPYHSQRQVPAVGFDQAGRRRACRGVATGPMRPTRAPDARRPGHEAAGEWPQPSLWAMLEARVERTPERAYLIEGREGGRQYTFGDLHARAAPGAGMQALEALEESAASLGSPSPPGPHDVSMLFYTSGTTADPKGVLHTPSTLGAVNHFHAKLFPPSPADRTLLQFPLTHIGG